MCKRSQIRHLEIEIQNHRVDLSSTWEGEPPTGWSGADKAKLQCHQSDQTRPSQYLRQIDAVETQYDSLHNTVH